MHSLMELNLQLLSKYPWDIFAINVIILYSIAKYKLVYSFGDILLSGLDLIV